MKIPRRFAKEAAAVKEHIDECGKRLDFIYRTLGRWAGRALVDSILRAHILALIAERDRLEKHIPLLRSAYQKLKGSGLDGWEWRKKEDHG